MSARIVCLVPSITELLCDLGLLAQIVGRTGFCIHPWESVRGIPKVGGTKDLKMEKIRALKPTHVIVNVDENRREDAETLREFVPHVIVTHPLAPLDNLELYRLLGGIFDREEAAERLCAEFESEFASIAERSWAAQKVLYLIWREPWMTVSSDTYISQMLALINWTTQPVGGAERYPTVELGDHPVDRILLSSEPFHFKHEHVAEVSAMMPGTQVSLIDGEMTSWYGSRAIAGLRYLQAIGA
jgi:ABC-type Fe3+-hydroxamate transport system substrate-binding protein